MKLELLEIKKRHDYDRISKYNGGLSPYMVLSNPIVQDRIYYRSILTISDYKKFTKKVG